MGITLLSTSLLVVSSCEDEIVSKKKDIEPDITSQSFDFKTKEDLSFVIEAKSANGVKGSNIPFYVYGEYPAVEEGEKVSPLYYGVTDDDGKLDVLVTVPMSVKTLYVLTPVGGYGSMQTIDLTGPVSSLSFSGIAPTEYVSTKGGEDIEYSSFEVFPSRKMNVFTFYEGVVEGKAIALNNNGAPKIEYKGIVSYVENREINKKADELFPEVGLIYKGQDNFLFTAKNCTDLVVTDEYGAEVWATYISDGTFYVHNKDVASNTLCYFHYPEGTVPDPKEVRKTILFPNTDSRDLESGIRVQLLYWNGEKYVKTFPKNTKIGWCMIQNAYSAKSNNVKKFSENKLKDLQYYRFSLAPMNKKGIESAKLSVEPYNQTVSHWSEEFKCAIVGVENRFRGQPLSDGKYSDDDYNDILFYVTSNPAVKPGIDIEIPEDPIDQKMSQSGTLAFEDMFPYKGDYDHNDFVTDYKYSLIKDNCGQLKSIEIVFDPRAVGATRAIGFGFELPQINKADIGKVTGAVYENDCSKPSFIVFNEVRNHFNIFDKSMINTYEFREIIPSNGEIKITIEMKAPLTKDETKYITFSKFNPFIFVDSRDNETHLINYKPTSKNKDSFGQGVDKSDGINTFYCTSERYAWALDIAKASEKTPKWLYPIEQIAITDAYVNYDKWATGGNKDYTWFDSYNPSNIKEDLIYKK